MPKFLQPLILAFIICTLVVAYGLNCGAILNPARDIAPRVFTALYGWGTDPFKYAHSFIEIFILFQFLICTMVFAHNLDLSEDIIGTLPV